jgi:hypothetical protein
VNHPEARRRARANVEVDTSVSPAERETAIHFSEAAGRASLFATERGMMNRALAHPEITIRELDVLEEPGSPRRRAVRLEEYDGGPVVGVLATFPVGLVKIRLSARGERASHADVVTEEVVDPITDGGEGGQ